MSDQHAEDVDEDKIGGDYPPELSLGAEDYGTTAAEEAIDEPLEERILREEPDVLPVDGRVTEDDEVDDTFDDAVQEHEGPVSAEEDAIHVIPE